MTSVIEKVNQNAGLALIRRKSLAGERTEWIDLDGQIDFTQFEASETIKGIISQHLAHHTNCSFKNYPSTKIQPTLNLNKPEFNNNLQYLVSTAHVETSKEPLENVIIFLHGRGDTPEPFIKLGEKMALPQTGVIALQAPYNLPFDMGATWIHDLDAEFNEIPPNCYSSNRSKSIESSNKLLREFLAILHRSYGWSYDRIFLFGFSQGACIAFHLAMTMSFQRLGGIIMVAGGLIHGPHNKSIPLQASTIQTPALLLAGLYDEVYPMELVQETIVKFRNLYGKKQINVIKSKKKHSMVDTSTEMREIMKFLSAHLYIRNIGLESQSDLIEITNTHTC